MMRLGISFVAILCTHAVARADDLDICERLSKSGLIDSRDASLTIDRANEEFDHICSSKENRIARAKAVSASGGGKYGLKSANFSGAKSSSEQQEIVDRYCQEGKRSEFEKISSNESVRNGTNVVQLIDTCITKVIDQRAEAILGYTRPSLASDESFDVIFAYRPSNEARLRKYKIAYVQADDKAGVSCYQMGENGKLTIESQQIVLTPGMSSSTGTAITCSKAEGKSVSGVFGLKSIEVNGSDSIGRTVRFEVRSPLGENILRSELKAEYDRKLEDLRTQSDAKLNAARTEFSNLLRQTVSNVEVHFGPSVRCDSGWEKAISVADCPQGTIRLSGACEFTCMNSDHVVDGPSGNGHVCRLISRDSQGRTFRASATCLRLP